MKFVKTIKKANAAGKCENCKETYGVTNGWKVLCKHQKERNIRTEKHTLCTGCKRTIQMQNTL